jgi:pyrroline-5-carboxylate reductase
MDKQHDTIAFIGGGNMASALIGGLLKTGRAATSLLVLDPGEAQRAKLQADFGVRTLAAADASLAEAALVVWAVKPQLFNDAARPCAAHVKDALQLSVMAGIRPALIGRGIAGLVATPAVGEAERALVEQVLAPTGQLMWLPREQDLDAVTALSGSGPAYVFYFVEAMMAAAEQMGLSAEQGKRLALATFDGAAALAAQSDEPPAVLRERVTSKGGTTYAGLESMRADGVAEAKPSQWFSRKALKQPSRERSRISV